MTERVIAAMEHPLVDCIGHLTGRLLLRRGNRISSELQLERLIQQGIFSSLASEGDGTGLESGPFAAETEVPIALVSAS